jgi:sec-independent protein translocase protein TatA
MNLGAPEIILIILAVLLLFGYKKLPDASRSIGRSLRIFKGEMKGMKDDDVRADVRTKDAAETTPVVPTATPSSGDLTAQLSAEAAEAEARAAEARAAALRARAEQARATDGRG